MQKPQSMGVSGSVGNRKTATGKATLSSVGGSWCATCAAHLEPKKPNSRAKCPPPVPPWGERGSQDNLFINTAARPFALLRKSPILRNSATGIRLGGYHHLRDNFLILLVFLPLTNTRISGTIELRRTGNRSSDSQPQVVSNVVSCSTAVVILPQLNPLFQGGFSYV